MTAKDESVQVPADVADLIGMEQYHEVGEFPVERGYIWTSCASVENGNPLFWEDDVADALVGGTIAPPTMVSVWFPRTTGRLGGRSRRCRSRCIST